MEEDDDSEDFHSHEHHHHHHHSHHGPPGRTRSGMSEQEQRSRRESIKGIMADHSLSAVEKRRSIQSLMDGRRRSSTTGCSVSSASAAGSDNPSGDYVSSMAAAAAAAAEYYDSSDDDMLLSDAEDDEDDKKRQHQHHHHHHNHQHGNLQTNNNNSNHNNTNNNNNNDSINPCEHVFVGRRASTSTAGDSSVSQISLGYGGPNRRGSATSSSGHNSNNNNSSSYAGSSSLNDDSNSTAIRNRELIQGLDDPETDDVKKRFRRYGRARSLQDFGDGAFAAAAAAAASFVKNDPRATNKRMEKSRPKCEHYERQCTIVTAFSVEQAGKKTKQDRRRSMPIDLEEEETHHEIDRFAIRELICRKCFTRQSSKTNNCNNCGIQFGEYHCDICNLWMSAKESPYHCHECGFCRVGGRENFRHCDDCGMCIDALLFDDHNCKVGKYMSNCPVCQEDLFSSRYASHEMPCGHAIHWHCFKELTSYDTRCPVCKKTAETADQMAATWSAMAMGIALQPVPADLARVVTILCYDCEQRDDNRRWHFLGVRCSNCLSFNTTVERTTIMGRDAAAFLDELDRQRDRRSSGGGGARSSAADAAAQGDYDAVMQQREVELQMQGMNMMDDGSTPGHNLGNNVLDEDEDDGADLMHD
ncbi:CHY zinc finger domain-containing protein 1 [Seminavis robusta]|uniref:CHY zinc finger domain-containing protein 1 n=1 Tax=Seminavis robusta TaxID=568900 RepID=A0A9N8E773_9STRA|nr:CHY zinc finger domain-containing protein 1 [Seminavis robusta]|eukprot:Sro695_g188680.1 CHY zinc finger domain-containing protein 1 (643) ;mRNA; r:21474-23726